MIPVVFSLACSAKIASAIAFTRRAPAVWNAALAGRLLFVMPLAEQLAFRYLSPEAFLGGGPLPTEVERFGRRVDVVELQEFRSTANDASAP